MKDLWRKLRDWLRSLWKEDPASDPDPIPDAIDPKEIRWLGVDVSAWEKRYALRVNVEGSRIVYDQQLTTELPAKDGMTGNPWIVANLNGRWTAATHEWMRAGQKVKNRRSVHGDHIKRPEFGNDWTPGPGEEYGFLVTGLARGGQNNAQVRTQIVLYRWPMTQVRSASTGELIP